MRVSPLLLRMLPVLALAGCGGESARLREENARLVAEAATARAAAEREALEARLRLEALAEQHDANEQELLNLRVERDVMANARQALAVQNAVLTSRVAQAEARVLEVERKAAAHADPWDLITMKNGSRLAGRVRALRNGEVEIQPADGLTVKGPVTGIASVEFRVPGLNPDKLPKPVTPATAPVVAPAPAPAPVAAPAPEVKPAPVPVSAPVPTPAVAPVTPAKPTASPTTASPTSVAVVVPPAPEPPPRLKVDVVKRKNQRTFEARSNFTKTMQVVEMEVTVTNLEPARIFTNLTARVRVLANGVADPNDYQVLQVENLPLKLDRFGKATVATAPRKLESTRSKSVFLQKGMEFYGVLVDVLDGAGKVVFTKGSPERVEQEVDKFRAAKEGPLFRL